jgi:hypothetical protein
MAHLYTIPIQEALDCNLFTELKDRVLFFDGDMVVPSSEVTKFLKLASTGKLCVTETTPDIEMFNSVSDVPIRQKEDVTIPDLAWNLPDPWNSLDVEAYIYERFEEELQNDSTVAVNAKVYLKRVEEEIEAYRDLKLYALLRAVIYTVSTLRSYNVVWGVGRGSSVSSYVLYLVGVHDVDSVFFELDYTDFLR